MNSIRVLLVEDNDADADLIADLAPSLDTQRARTFAEALASEEHDVVLLDLGLPETRGIETLVRFREHSSTPVIVLTGTDDEELGREAIRQGAQDFLPKGELSRPLLQRSISHALERHQLARRLASSQGRLGALVESAPVVVMEITNEGRVSMVNRKLGHLSRDALLGSDVQSVVAAHTDLRGDLVAMLDSTSSSLQTKWTSPDGGVRWYDVHHARFGDEGEHRHVVIWNEITAFKGEQERFAKALEATPGGMMLVDGNGTIILANRNVESILGYAPEELAGTPVERLVPASSRARHELERSSFMVAPSARSMNDGRSVEGVAKDGTLTPLEIVLTPVSTSHGTEILCAITDVRASQRIQEQLRRAQRVEAVGLLAGGVAHDFNNILTVILSFGEYVMEELQDGTVREDMEEVMAAAHRAVSLTTQLLAFTRRQPQAPSTFQLAEMLENLRKLLGRVLGEDIHLVMEAEPSCGTVYLDESMLEHAIVNLAVNARDAMPAGGSLTIECGDVELDGELQAVGGKRPRGSYVRLRIQDTGHGMDEATRAKVFDPFFTTKEADRGTGLGLPTVFATVTEAGGFVDLQSEIGKGTTLDLYLPRSEASDSFRDATLPPPKSRGRERVLVVDDDQLVRDVVHRCLDDHGYDVTTVATGKQALAVVSEQPPFDLVVTDVVMPEIDGVELAVRLRDQSVAAPVLFMTGYAPEEVHKRGLLNHSNVIRKPFRPHDLARRVRTVIDAERNDTGESGAESANH